MDPVRTSVVHIHHHPYDVYIGRPRAGQPWNFGNPFRVGRDGPTGHCIEKFRRWIEHNDPQGCQDATPSRRQWILDNLHTLQGKRLGCFCSPRPCHGDVLADLANTH
jgi:hypothetical protein